MFLLIFISTGAKNESDVVYMVKWDGDKKEKFISSRKFIVPLIDFLQSKIVFEKNDTVDQLQARSIQSCDEYTVICKLPLNLLHRYLFMY